MAEALSVPLIAAAFYPGSTVGRSEELRAEAERNVADALDQIGGEVEVQTQVIPAQSPARGLTTAQVAIARVLSRGDDIVPLVGARRRDRLAEALGALELDLSGTDLASIERAVPSDAAAGERYDAQQLAILDSEQGGAVGV